jgi:hypothetical protein
MCPKSCTRLLNMRRSTGRLSLNAPVIEILSKATEKIEATKAKGGKV